MAKTRVYELARDLNLTNKILLNKLNDLDISVKSHMSALEDDVVASIKQQLFGKKEETIEETRIKPTVIRRRKKNVTVAPAAEPIPQPEAADDAEMPAEEVPEKTEPVKASEAAAETPAAVEAQTDEDVNPAAEEAVSVHSENATGAEAEIERSNDA